jgi:hypothetical protein
MVLNWLRNRYHKPSDDLTQPLDFSETARFARSVLALASVIANDTERPRWNDGAFFARFVR